MKPPHSSLPGVSSQRRTSYGQILKSSSIIGGAQLVNCLVGIVRMKVVAVLLGPTGIGLVGLYQSATNLVGTVAGLGIASSGVREVAEADGKGDPESVAHAVKSLRRACWVTGVIGWLLTAALAYPLSIWTFGSGERALPIAILGATLLLGSITGGQTALLQGVRKIADLARLNVISVMIGTVVAVCIYSWLGERGIIPVMLATAVLNLGVSWWFSRRVQVNQVDQTVRETLERWRGLLGLGLAFMWSGLVTSGVALVIRSVVVRDLGLDANGLYQAAWGISGMLGGFILNAMGTDFYPRLTAVAQDDAKVNHLVNEQTEIGVLLALPGLLATLACAPWMLGIFYTEQFFPAALLLPWFVLGIFGRVLSWPLGYIILAKGASWLYAISETIFCVIHVVLAFTLLRSMGLIGVAVAFAFLYGIYLVGMRLVVGRVSGFEWSPETRRLGLHGMALLLVGFLTVQWLPRWPALGLGFSLSAISCVFSLRGLTVRLGGNHRLVRFACKFSAGRLVCGV
jgi:antigen flippase